MESKFQFVTAIPYRPLFKGVSDSIERISMENNVGFMKKTRGFINKYGIFVVLYLREIRNSLYL